MIDSAIDNISAQLDDAREQAEEWRKRWEECETKMNRRCRCLELEAQCAALRAAMDIKQKDFILETARNSAFRQVLESLPLVSLGQVNRTLITEALKIDAGRALLDELRLLRAVADAAKRLLCTWGEITSDGESSDPEAWNTLDEKLCSLAEHDAKRR